MRQAKRTVVLKLLNLIKKLFRWWQAFTPTPGRFLFLCLALGLGVFLGCEYDALCSDSFYLCQKEVKARVIPVVIGLPVFLFLWMFRTYDRKAQLEATPEKHGGQCIL